MSVLVASPLLMGNAIAARRCFFETAIEEKPNGLTHGSLCTGRNLDTKLLEKADGAVAHAATENDIRFLLVDELGNHARLMTIRKRIGNSVGVLDFVVLHIYKDVVGATAKMMADGAIQPAI